MSSLCVSRFGVTKLRPLIPPWKHSLGPTACRRCWGPPPWYLLGGYLALEMQKGWFTEESEGLNISLSSPSGGSSG